MQLTERKQRILSAVVSGFITNGEPVGSKSIADKIGVSSATIRNEMAELIELGLLEQPHTSAGRLPSQKGIRIYIDMINPTDELSDLEKRYFDSHLIASSYDSEKLLEGISRIIPQYTKGVSIVSTPNDGEAVVRAVQFVQISRRAAMLILMSSSGAIKNKMFYCDFDITNEIIRLFFRVFNEKLRNTKIAEITIPYIQTLGASFGEMSMLSSPALLALLEAAQEMIISQVMVSGQMNLIYYPELDYADVRNLIGFFEHKDELTRILNQNPLKVTVLIGREIGIKELDKCSAVITRYNVGDVNAGGIAAIGPIRMDYVKIISAMRYLSVRVGEILTSLMEES